MYMSVLEAAEKFNISKRRVQTLCEHGRIAGANRISGVWLIPVDAQKPNDARKKSNTTKEKLKLLNNVYETKTEKLTISQVCELFSVSKATVKNWIKLGKLKSNLNGDMFDKKYVEELLNEIKDSDDSRLKSRRNKKTIQGKMLYKDYINDESNCKIIENILNSCEQITEDELRIMIANFAIQLYKQSGGIVVSENALFEGKTKITNNHVFNVLIKDLLGNVKMSKITLRNIQLALNYKVKLVPMEDTLGFAYISLRDLGIRKKTGIYYTPQHIVSSLINNLEKTVDINNKLICDPCCGTGNFLIGLVNKGVKVSNIYGQDVDEISIAIARINMFLLDNSLTLKQIYSQFVCGNTLLNTFPNKFSVVLGNPPWGYDFKKEEIDKLITKYVTAKISGAESYDLFIEKGLEMLDNDGYLAYILPEALLSVNSHKQAREIIVKNSSFKFVNFLGNAFPGVQCPSIILGLQKDYRGQIKQCRLRYSNEEFVVTKERKIDTSIFSFNMNDEEYDCLHAISSVRNARYLANNAKFALGIVTGDNRKYIKDKKSNGVEILLKGSNIYRYAVGDVTNYIKYVPEAFQQVAPTEIYRAKEKLLYRFISEVPVFTYDNEQKLSLNSCNILIPQIEGMNIKYVLAVLNSSVAAYFITKKYNSVKLLRGHIEALPIPMISSEEQNKIIEKVDCLINSCNNAKEVYKELDEKIMDIYSLSKKQRKIIYKALANKKKYFLEAK